MKNSGQPERRVGLGRGPGPARHTPLNPGKGLRRGDKPLGRRKELRSKASAQTGGDPQPRPRKAPGTAASPGIPERTRKFVYRRDEDTCARCARWAGEGNRQIQHRDARGSGGAGRKVDAHRLSNLVLVCGASATDPAGCHYAIESQPDQAREDGYRVPMNVDPETVPILWHDGKRYFLCDDGDRYALVEMDAPP